MKKTVVIALAAAMVMALGAAGVYAAGQIARVNAISEEAALNFACVDSGVRPEDVEAVRVKFGQRKGAFVYDIVFEANGDQYAYTVDSASGAVLEMEREALADPAAQAEEGAPAQPDEPAVVRPESGPRQETEAQAAETIGIDRAEEIALKAAGLSASDVAFSKAMLARDDGRVIYEIEFYIAGETEYEYEIDAHTGEILDEDIEPWDDDD